MRLVPGAGTCLSKALLPAAWLAVLVGVAVDVTGGSHPAHIAAVAAIATTLGFARSIEGARYRFGCGLLGSLVVAQPVLHAADVISLGSLREAPGAADGDSTQSAAYVQVTVLLIAGVGAAEVVTHATWSALRALRRLVGLVLASAPIDAALVLPPSRIAVPLPRRRVWNLFALRRGPPARFATSLRLRLALGANCREALPSPTTVDLATLILRPFQQTRAPVIHRSPRLLATAMLHV